MIVTYTEKGWNVITQRAHGIVAAQIAFQWKAGDRPERWVETILAIAEHDDAENELDGELLITGAGGPLDFAMKKFELPHCNKLASLVITKSRFIALLTSMHMEFLYGREDSIPADAKKFLKEQSALQEQWRSELKLSRAESLRIYNLLEFCDAISLLICKGDLQPEGRSVEISTGPDNKSYYLIKQEDGSLSVEPWPFDAAGFTINFDSRNISSISFKSSAEFRKAFIAAPVVENTITLVKKIDQRASARSGKKLAK